MKLTGKSTFPSKGREHVKGFQG